VLLECSRVGGVGLEVFLRHCLENDEAAQEHPVNSAGGYAFQETPAAAQRIVWPD
jgi:hypothetical protein